MEIVIATFSEHGFTIRREKCEGLDESAVFCGFRVSNDGSVKPWPIKRQLNEVAAATAAELFSKAKSVAETKHVLRSWLGTSNYFNKWLPAELRAQSLSLHSQLQKLETGEVSRKDVSESAVDFVEKLCQWWIENSYGLYGGSGQSENTLIITDANVSGWSGCIFRLVEIERGSTSFFLPFSLDGFLSANERFLIPSDKKLDDFMLLPVRFDGARWSTQFERSQSSTWRERAACMLIVHRNRDCLAGKTFIVSDNKNLVGTWKETEALTAGLCNAFQTYISHVHGGIHVKRTHPVLQWVDHCARNLSVSVNIKRVQSESDDDDDPEKRLRLSTLDENVDFERSDDSDFEDLTVPLPEDQEMDFNESIGRYKLIEIKTALDHGWIRQKEDNFFTTSSYPGKVVEGSRIVPTVDAAELIQFIHFNYGHATAAGIRKYLSLWKLWIINFKLEVSKVVNSCEYCLKCRDTFHPRRTSIPMTKKPMEMLMADFLQPEKDLQPGFLVFRDRFSGYCEGRAIEKLDSLEVQQLLTEWIARFSAPLIFHTDNGRAFRSNLMKDFYTKYRIFHRETPTYDPQANGSVERTIKTIEEGLRVELASGLPAQEAIHVVCGRINRTVSVPGSADSLCPRSVVLKFEDVHPYSIETGREKVPFKADIPIGQKVLVKIPNVGKLSPQFKNKGYSVHSIEGNQVYSLIDQDGAIIPYLYRRDRLKPITVEFRGQTKSPMDVTSSEEGVCD
jgi:hypothetical protein